MDPETVAAIIRVTGGNFCLLGRLFKQAHRILEINGLNSDERDGDRRCKGKQGSGNRDFMFCERCKHHPLFCQAFTDSFGILPKIQNGRNEYSVAFDRIEDTEGEIRYEKSPPIGRIERTNTRMASEILIRELQLLKEL